MWSPTVCRSHVIRLAVLVSVLSLNALAVAPAQTSAGLDASLPEPLYASPNCRRRAVSLSAGVRLAACGRTTTLARPNWWHSTCRGLLLDEFASTVPFARLACTS